MGNCIPFRKNKKVTKNDLRNDTLRPMTNQDIPEFSFNGINRVCKVVDVYDADTFRVIFFLNSTDSKPVKIKIRAAGCNAAEMRPLKTHENRLQEIAMAIRGRNRLLQLVTCVQIHLDTKYSKNEIKKILDTNFKLVYIKLGHFDKYGRILGTLYEDSNKNLSINQILIDEKYAVSYDGGHRDKKQLTIT